MTKIWKQCTGFIQRGTKDGVPTQQCRRRYLHAIILWPGEAKEIESKLCTQHKDQAVKEAVANRVPYRIIHERV